MGICLAFWKKKKLFILNKIELCVSICMENAKNKYFIKI